MRPVTIKYRDGHNKIVTIKATSCSGEIPAHSNTYYCLFYLGDEPYGNGMSRRPKQIARVAQSRLLPGYYEVYQKLFGRPWLAKLQAMDKIALSEYRDWENEISGYPQDTETIWSINYHRSEMWVIQCPDRCILHVMNNEEVTRKGAPREALKKLFPGKKVHLLVPTTVAVEL